MIAIALAFVFLATVGAAAAATTRAGVTQFCGNRYCGAGGDALNRSAGSSPLIARQYFLHK